MDKTFPGSHNVSCNRYFKQHTRDVEKNNYEHSSLHSIQNRQLSKHEYLWMVGGKWSTQSKPTQPLENNKKKLPHTFFKVSQRNED